MLLLLRPHGKLMQQHRFNKGRGTADTLLASRV
jgi:hypothetical protein